MSGRVDLKEFLSAYLAEVEEQLESANRQLLEIDASARDGKSNPRAVRELFRALHTVKGLSAMVGVEPAVAIAHRMETLLRQADRSGGHLPPASVEALLQATRAIEHRIRELAAGKEASPAPAAVLEALERFESNPGGTALAPPPGLDLDPAILSKLAPFERDLLADGARSGRRAVRADFAPSPKKAERGLSINTVRERVGAIAEIVKVVPVSVPPSEEAPGALSFALLLLTSASNDDLAAAVGIDASALLPISQVVTRSESPAPEEGEIDEGSDVLAPQQRRNVVRVDVARLDDAMEHLSALIVTRSRLMRAVAELTSAGVATRELVAILRDNSRQLRDLRAAILRVRMVPVAEIFDRIPLILRGLRRDSDKIVRLKVDVGDAELDKGVAERLFPAIVHLVRNAVDHAIEPPAERVSHGKPEESVLRVTCSARSNTHVELVLADDGRGVDVAAVARRVGRPIESPTALLDALCRSGMSTRTEATTTSGRGIGMDIVKRVVVDQLGGELTMRTEPGRGTAFVLKVPISISIVDTFAMECGTQRFVVPVAMVEEVIEVASEKVRYGPAPARGDARTGVIEHRGEAVPLIDLAAWLDMPPRTLRQAIVVRRGEEPIAFGLDRVTGQQEAVIRPLLDPLLQAPGMVGSTDLGDGKPTLVLDLLAIGATLSEGTGDRPR